MTTTKTRRRGGAPADPEPVPEIRRVVAPDQGGYRVRAVERLEVPLDRLHVSPGNRPVQEDAALAELRASIEQNGVLQALLVRRRDDGGFEIIAGARRAAAARGVLEAVPCDVLNVGTVRADHLRVVENVQRQDLAPLEEAQAFEDLVAHGYTVEQAAAEVGKSVGHVARRRNLLNLSPAWRAVLAGQPGAGRTLRGAPRSRDLKDEDGVHPARAWGVELLELVATQSHETQDVLLGDASFGEVPTRAQLRRQLAKLSADLSLAPWDLADEALAPKAGSCAACPKRSDRGSPGLFDAMLDIAPRAEKAAGAAALCLDLECWRGKLAAHARARVAAARAEHGDALLVVAQKPRFGHEHDRHELSGIYFGSGVHAGLGKVVRHDDVCGCKSGAKGARPAIFLDGDFRVRWVTLARNGEARSSAAARAAGGEKAKAAPAKGEKERRADALRRLAARRDAWVLDQVSAALEELEPIAEAAKDQDPAKALAAFQLLAVDCLGGNGPERLWNETAKAREKRYLALDKARAEACRHDVEGDLWRSVTRPRLAAVLNRHGLAQGSLGPLVGFAVSALSPLGLDVPALILRSESEIAPPKWLAAEKAEPTAKPAAEGRRRGASKRSGKKAKGRARKS